MIIFFDIGLVKDANVSSTSPSLLIKILWKFHLGIADLPWLSLAHLNNSWAFLPLTSVIIDNGKLILKLTSQNSFTSLLFFFSWLNEFDGIPTTIRPLDLYKSHNSCNSSYCFVKPQ